MFSASQAAGLKKSALSVTFVVELTCTEAESHLADADQIEAIKLMQKVGPIDSLQGAIWVDFVFKASDEKSAVSKRLIEELAKVVQLQKPKIPAVAAKSAIEKVSVFASTLFCLDKRNQSRVNDLILAAFEEHPTYDYFFLMQPINVITSGSVTSTMFPVPIRRGVTTTQSLFAIHREYFTMYSQFTVSVYTPEMSLPLEVFLLSLGSSAPSVSQLLGTTPSQTVPVNVCYVALVQNRVVGFLSFVRRAIASEEFTAFRRDFEIDRVVDLNRHRTRAQTFIHRWYMRPIFEGRGSYFLSEAMRQSSKSLVYLSDDMIKDTADFVIQKLYPVRPRLWGKHDKSFIITPATNLFTASSALYFASKRMLFKCRKVVESRVVVVGNSAAAFAHLAKHIYNHAIYFTNISVVVDTIFYGLQIPSTAPLENHVYQKSFEGHFAPVNHEYLSSEEFVRQGFYRRLKVFEGTLTDIDRISQAIVISDGQIIDYDFLVLSVSTQGKKKLLTIVNFPVFITICLYCT